MNAATAEDPGTEFEPFASDAPLKVMAETTPTRFFNDSCAALELTYAIDRGATGATSNPVICLAVLRSEGDRWLPRAAELIRRRGPPTSGRSRGNCIARWVPAAQSC